MIVRADMKKNVGKRSGDRETGNGKNRIFAVH